jgi:pantoate--beta-alanine ligase
MNPTVCHGVTEFRKACDEVRRTGARLGLVPTMGALHDGHLSLVREARQRADCVAVTIFVNPTQFGPAEDFERYPRDLESDLEKCRLAGATHVFAPPVDAMYPAGERTRVRVDALTAHLCGASRPGHFEGVTTIVAKLFCVAGPCVAVFGRKDYQQLKVIERLARDLLLPVEIVGCRTVRESDGLALSSRNAYLAPEQRTRALAIPRGLSRAVKAYAAGERRAGALREVVARELVSAGLRLDYATVADADELAPLDEGADVGDRALLAVAAFAGSTRLIDNVVFSEDPAPISEPAR